MGFDGSPVFMQTSGSFSELVFNTGPLAMTILVILLLLSVVSWTIIFEKIRFFIRSRRQSVAFLNIFRDERSLRQLTVEAANFPDSPEAVLARSVGREIAEGELRDLSHLDMFIESRIESIVAGWESYLIFLSTTATIAPFLGLLGTVWGIMSSFMNMGEKGSADLYVVGPGIADALITTIFGLGAAIPAVIGYNAILRTIRRREEELSSFSVRLKTRLLERRYSELEKG